MNQPSYQLFLYRRLNAFDGSADIELHLVLPFVPFAGLTVVLVDPHDKTQFLEEVLPPLRWVVSDGCFATSLPPFYDFACSLQELLDDYKRFGWQRQEEQP